MPKASVKGGSVMGIPVYLHYSFLLILPFLAWAFGNNLKSMVGYVDIPMSRLQYSPYVWGFVIAVAVFGSVLLHELGHSFVAIKKGVKIRGITLMLFGGVAQLEEMPSGPGEEAQVALAGPLVSFLVGAACILSVPAIGRADHPNLAFSVSYLGYINIFLGVFNLIPAFPMDGGRILRSLLAARWPFVAATKVAANVGKVFAVAFGMIGLVGGNLFLVLIAFFIYIGASQEYQFTIIKTSLDGFRVRDLMTTDVASIAPDTSIAVFLEQMMRQRHMGYPVLQGGRLVGCATLEDVEKLRPDQRAVATVGDVMSRDPITVGPDDDIYMALKLLSENGIGRLPVIEDGRLVGILSRSDVMHGFKVRNLTA
jgi:Zn-dependent protease/CBS domain-containing protein